MHGMSQHMRPASWKDCRLPRLGTSSRTHNLKSRSISWTLMQTCWGKVESGSVDGAAFPMIPDAFRMIQWIFNGARLKDNQRCPWVTLADSCHVSPTRWKTAFLSSFKQEKSRRPWPWQWRWAWRRSEGSFWRSYGHTFYHVLSISWCQSFSPSIIRINSQVNEDKTSHLLYVLCSRKQKEPRFRKGVIYEHGIDPPGAAWQRGRHSPHFGRDHDDVPRCFTKGVLLIPNTRGQRAEVKVRNMKGKSSLIKL